MSDPEQLPDDIRNRALLAFVGAFDLFTDVKSNIDDMQVVDGSDWGKNVKRMADAKAILDEARDLIREMGIV